MTFIKGMMTVNVLSMLDMKLKFHMKVAVVRRGRAILMLCKLDILLVQHLKSDQ